MEKQFDLKEPLWKLNCGEFLSMLSDYVQPRTLACDDRHSKQAIGIHDLAIELGCSVSMLYVLKKNGVLNDSIISHIGKKVVFNVEKARSLANTWRAQHERKK